MPKPKLGGVIQAKDVHYKGGGSFRAKYMAWAKVAQLLNEHANEWQFCLKFTEQGSPIWQAPDGTGYLQCYFKHEDGSETSINVFSVMNNRNDPIKYDQISSRDLTDSHRRALCQSAAMTFSLGYELWADEEITNVKVDLNPETQFRQPQTKTKDDLVEDLMSLLTEKIPDENKAKDWVSKKAELFDLKEEGAKLKQMTKTHLQECIKELKDAK